MCRPAGATTLSALDRAMAAKGMSVQDLAVAIERHPSLIYQIRRGEKLPSLQTARRISKVLGTDIESLFGGLLS